MISPSGLLLTYAVGGASHVVLFLSLETSTNIDRSHRSVVIFLKVTCGRVPSFHHVVEVHVFDVSVYFWHEFVFTVVVTNQHDGQLAPLEGTQMAWRQVELEGSLHSSLYCIKKPAAEFPLSITL